MKKLILLTINFILLVGVSFGQEFLGIKVDGKKDEVVNSFKSKGFKIVGDVTKDDITMEGEVMGKQIELYILSSPISKTVWRFVVYLPTQSSWALLKNDYENYLQILTDKYGEPKSKYNFFMSPYKEGDGYEMNGVYLDKCRFTAFWADETISVKISKFKQVNISYTNSVNSDLDDKENSELAMKAF